MADTFPPENPEVNLKFRFMTFLAKVFKNKFKLAYVRNKRGKIYLVLAKKTKGKFLVPLTLNYLEEKETRIYALNEDGSLSNGDGSNLNPRPVENLQWIAYDKSEAVFMMMSYPEQYQRFNDMIKSSYEEELRMAFMTCGGGKITSI